MPYNPNTHHRRSIRLKGYDYSRAGLYFITICCQDRVCRFGHIDNDEIILNEFGQIAYNEWVKLTERFTNFELDVFQIMPNHIHGIIALNDTVGAGFTPAQNGDNSQNVTTAPNGTVIQTQNGAVDHNQNETFIHAQYGSDSQNGSDDDKRAGASPAPTVVASVSDIVGAYKSLVANGCLEIYKLNNKTMGKLWQRDYYEHIIRNEQSYETISNYIINNPAKWKDDKFYK
jgi:REP element-mobilizing transposase RayT